ncbi:MAG: chromosomal replication initiator protein DnaA [Anaerolineae bacterium]
MSSHQTPDELWQAALGDLELSVTAATYDTWLRPTRAIGFDGDLLLISTPNAYGKDWIENRLGAEVRRAISRIACRPLDFRVVVSASSANGNRPIESRSTGENGSKPHTPKPSQATLTLERPELNAKYTFANFIVGDSNKLAVAAASAVAESPASRFNPLFLYGGVGLGKTHLLQAIGHHLAARRYRVRYVTTETFTNDLVGAIRTQTQEEFRNRYRQVDVLLLDDIQFLIGKEMTQEEVFHTFNAMHGANRQIVISSDRRPHALMPLEARLRSRFEAGLVADIQPPDLEMRIAILKSHAEAKHLAVSDDVLQIIAQRVQSNIRELEGALVQVVGRTQLTHEPLTVQTAQRILSADVARPAPGMDVILEAVAEHYRVSLEEMLSSKRTQRIVTPRHVAMYLMREDGRASLPQIGLKLRRDHTTVLHGIERIAQQEETNEALRKDIIAIRERLFRR